MIHDDEPVGRLLSRREAVALLGITGGALLTGCGVEQAQAGAEALSCVVRPQQTEGPYFVDEQLDRSDIRSDPSTGQVKPGTLLTLTMIVSRVNGADCKPLPGALVDLWQCDALGVYSDVRDPGFDTTGQKFLRGFQRTNERGEARFLTVYPGWYAGRTVHIHFKIRTDPGQPRGHEFVSQLYFDDTLTDRIFAAEPYAAKGQRTTRNRNDGIFRRGGDQLLLAPTTAADGYAASFALGLQVP